LAEKLETSTRPAEPRSPRARWLARLGAGPTMTREDIERDAAAQLGVPVGFLGQSEDTAAEHDTGDQGVAITRAERRPGRIAGRLRALVSPEPADVRRQRIEAEAAAQLGVGDHGEQRAS
jgi:hypothetical protein